VGGPAFGDGGVHGVERAPRVAIDAHDDFGGAHGGSRDKGAVDDEVRIAREQQSILAARRLALRSVDDDDRSA